MTAGKIVDQMILRTDDYSDNPRAWQRMLSGRRLDLLAPDPKDIDIQDIAHGLARVARWNGQTHGEHAFSVAQHSVIVEMICTETHPHWSSEWRLAALLHDAAEYVVGDLISPFKATIGDSYKSIETRLMRAIHQHFDIPQTLPNSVIAAIKQADHTSAYFEATRLAGFSEAEALKYFGNPKNLPASLHEQLTNLTPLSTQKAQTLFLNHVNSIITNTDTNTNTNTDTDTDTDTGHPMSEQIHVCSLDALENTLTETGATHLISLLNNEFMIDTPTPITSDNHLKLTMSDISEPMNGRITPERRHIEQLIIFVNNWDKNTPLLIHCLAGISRSTAAAFITLCTLNPNQSEDHIAGILRQQSSTAHPNRLLIEHADSLLGRDGKMIDAVENMDLSVDAYEGEPFSLPIQLPIS